MSRGFDFDLLVERIEGLVDEWPQVRTHRDFGFPQAARFFYGRGWDREFVFIEERHGVVGLSIRSNESSLPGFKRRHVSDNWWEVDPREVDESVLDPLVMQSYKLCQLRNCGVVQTDPLGEAHMVLVAALRACDMSCWPPPPWHLGGPKPSCSQSYQESISQWCASLLEDVFEAIGYLGATEAVRRVVTAYANEPVKTRAFLQELDRRILIGELEQKRKFHLPGEKLSAIQQVLWRGTNEKGNLVAWIALLENDDYGLLAKIGRRWRWSEGDRDSILATVPDELFESAVAAVSSSP